MLNLAEYRSRPTRLADYLPWAALVAPGVVLNKDGSFQRSAGFRGPDLESATEAELIAACARLNNAFRRLGSGWAAFFEAERRPAPGYPESDWPDPVSWLVDRERCAAFEEEGAHFESDYTLTFVCLPPAEGTRRAEKLLVEAPADSRGLDYRTYLEGFLSQTDRMLDLLGGVLPELVAYDDDATLTYLHRCVSTCRHPVTAPETPMYLDAFLPDQSLTGGLDPMLGDARLRTVTVQGFPGSTTPGILDDLNRLGMPYRWVTRFLPLDKSEAERVLGRYRRQWFAKRKGVVAILREVMFNEAQALVDSDADNKAADADAAMQELGDDLVSFGYLTVSVTVWDPDIGAVEDKVRAVERILGGRGFTTIAERLNAVEAWLGSLPGHCYANIRQPLVSSLNLAHLIPLSAVWAGPDRNVHLDGPPLLHAETAGHIQLQHPTLIAPPGGYHQVIVEAWRAHLSVSCERWRLPCSQE